MDERAPPHPKRTRGGRPPDAVVQPWRANPLAAAFAAAARRVDATRTSGTRDDDPAYLLRALQEQQRQQRPVE